MPSRLLWPLASRLVSGRSCAGATILSPAVWLVLGFLGATIAQEPRPKNYILNVIQSGELDVHTPLRWQGVLRDEPATLPWGVSYEIELTSVDYRDVPISIQGGLRATYSPDADEHALPNVHAGDQVGLVAQARLPQFFREEGAFERRAYLGSQEIDLTTALRSTELLERNFLTDGNNLEVSCFVACPQITAQINSTKPQTPPDQQSHQQQ